VYASDGTLCQSLTDIQSNFSLTEQVINQLNETFPTVISVSTDPLTKDLLNLQDAANAFEQYNISQQLANTQFKLQLNATYAYINTYQAQFTNYEKTEGAFLQVVLANYSDLFSNYTALSELYVLPLFYNLSGISGNILTQQGILANISNSIATVQQSLDNKTINWQAVYDLNQKQLDEATVAVFNQSDQLQALINAFSDTGFSVPILFAGNYARLYVWKLINMIMSLLAFVLWAAYFIEKIVRYVLFRTRKIKPWNVTTRELPPNSTTTRPTFSPFATVSTTAPNTQNPSVNGNGFPSFKSASPW